MDLLDPAGRVRRLRVGRPRQPALRRHRRAVQEVGRRQRRRLLPVRADRPRAAPTACAARSGDAVYLSLTVYGGPDDGRYSERIVGTSNDRDRRHRARRHVRVRAQPGAARRRRRGSSSSPTRCARSPATTSTTRSHGRRVEWHIEAVDPPATYREDDAELARRFRAAVTWIDEQAEIVPLALGEPNTIDEPYPVPTSRPSAGPPATPPTPWAASTSPTTRRS